jgi:hypothetical protein
LELKEAINGILSQKTLAELAEKTPLQSAPNLVSISAAKSPEV